MIYRELYTARANYPCNIDIVQGSNANTLIFNIVDWTIPSGSTCQIFLKKPSGLIIYNAGTISENNLTFPTTTQMTAEVGTAVGQIRVINGDVVQHTFELKIRVGESIIDDDAIESTDEFTALEEALAEVQDCVTKTEVAGTGSATRGVYFDANGAIQQVDAPTVGSATKGVYFNSGIPTAMTYSLEKNVPSNAALTDTTDLTQMTNVLPIAHGGTGSSTAAAALSALGAEPYGRYSISNQATIPVGSGYGNQPCYIPIDTTIGGIVIPAWTMGFLATNDRIAASGKVLTFVGVAPDGAIYSAYYNNNAWSNVNITGKGVTKIVSGSNFTMRLYRYGNMVTALIQTATEVNTSQTEANLIPDGYTPVWEFQYPIVGYPAGSCGRLVVGMGSNLKTVKLFTYSQSLGYYVATVSWFTDDALPEDESNE